MSEGQMRGPGGVKWFNLIITVLRTFSAELFTRKCCLVPRMALREIKECSHWREDKTLTEWDLTRKLGDMNAPFGYNGTFGFVPFRF